MLTELNAGRHFLSHRVLAADGSAISVVKKMTAKKSEKRNVVF